MSRTASSFGMVRIDFELDCDGPCYFSMYEVNYMSWYIHKLLQFTPILFYTILVHLTTTIYITLLK